MGSARMTQQQYAEYLARDGRPGSPATILSAARKPAPTRRHRSKDRLEGLALLLFQVRSIGLQEPVPEFRFYPVRRWRTDLAWPDAMLLVEYEGAVFLEGRHTRGEGYESDCEKYNTATLMGYRVLRFTHRMVENGSAVQMIERAILKAPAP